MVWRTRPITGHSLEIQHCPALYACWVRGPDLLVQAAQRLGDERLQRRSALPAEFVQGKASVWVSFVPHLALAEYAEVRQGCESLLFSWFGRLYHNTLAHGMGWIASMHGRPIRGLEQINAGDFGSCGVQLAICGDVMDRTCCCYPGEPIR